MSRPLAKRCPSCGTRQKNLAKHIDHCRRTRPRSASRPLVAPVAKPAEPDRLNVYQCGCGWSIVTIDVAEGVTPAMMSCGRCGEPAMSCFYDARAVRGRQPTHEWYVPDADEFARLTPEVQEHVAKGGLNLRRRGAATSDEPPAGAAANG